MTNWETVDRPGYFGRHRDERRAAYDAQYGRGQWRIVWEADGRLFGFEQMVLLYEDAYVAYLGSSQGLPWLAQLVESASDVYDDAPSNVASGLDYLKQETSRTHVQDVAIRRAVVRLRETFRGQQLIQIRDSQGSHVLSMVLSPGQVPFHRPELILKPFLEGWWEPGSVECFYQSNKLLQVQR